VAEEDELEDQANSNERSDSDSESNLIRDSDSGDSSDVEDPRYHRPAETKLRKANHKTPMRREAGAPRMVAFHLDRQADTTHGKNVTATFGERRSSRPSSSGQRRQRKDSYIEGPQNISWTPAAGSDQSKDNVQGKKRRNTRNNVASFGASFDRGDARPEVADADRRGRTHRRTGVRSGSRNVFRRL